MAPTHADVVTVSEAVARSIGIPRTTAPSHHFYTDCHITDFQLPLYPVEPIVPPSRPTRRDGGAPLIVTSNGNEESAAFSLSNARWRSVVGITGGARKLQLLAPGSRNGGCNEITGASCSAGGRLSGPIPFDPFTGVECARVLMQPPQSNQHVRRDDATVRDFRDWITKHFPPVLQSFEGLQALQKRRRRKQQPGPSHPQDDKIPADTSLNESRSQLEAEDADGSVDRSVADEGRPGDDAIPIEDILEDDKSEGDPSLDGTLTDREALRQAQHDAWALLLEHARLVALAPEDEFVTQDRTHAGDVFFVLTGVCDLSFRPDFLPVLLAEKERDRRRQQQQQQPGDPQDRSNPSASPLSPTRRQHSPRRDNAEGRRLERRLSLTCLSSEDVRRVEETTLHIRSLTSGDFFGLDAALFSFAYHLVTATSRGAHQRNTLGVTVPVLMHVLRVPSAVLQQMRKITRDAIERVHQDRRSHSASMPSGSTRCPRVMENASKSATPRPSSVFPYRYDAETVEFLRETFLFAPMSDARLQFLAAHMRPHRVRKHEFLFTTGQRVSVFLVRSGQLTLCASESVRTAAPLHDDQGDGNRSRDANDGRVGTGSGCIFEAMKSAIGRRHADNNSKNSRKTPAATTVETETRTVELEILQAHDTAGLLEACLLQESFTRYCVATTSDVCAFVVSPVALLAALAQEPASATLVADVLLRRHAWYSLRLFTSRNQHNPKREFKLSLGAQQRRSPLPCSRCGWTGHSSTSSICLRVESLRAVIANRPVAYPSGVDRSGAAPCSPRPANNAASSQIELGTDAVTPNARQRGRGQLFHSVQLAAMTVLPLQKHTAPAGGIPTAEVPSPSSSWLTTGLEDATGSNADTIVTSPDKRRQRRLDQSRQRLDDALRSIATIGNSSPRATTASSSVCRPVPVSLQSVGGRPSASMRQPDTQPSPHHPLQAARSRE